MTHSQKDLGRLMQTLSRLREILDGSYATLGPISTGRAAGLAWIALIHAQALERNLAWDIEQANLAVAKAGGKEDEYYDQLAAKAAKEQK